MVPVQATVIMLSFPCPSVTLTITAGRGYSIFPGFHVSFIIFIYPSVFFNALYPNDFYTMVFTVMILLQDYAYSLVISCAASIIAGMICFFLETTPGSINAPFSGSI